MTENDLTLTFVNVGYGEAILLQRGSFTALIDGGAGDPREYENSTTGRIRVIDYLRKRKISHLDLLVATHIHEDHVSGLVPVDRKFPQTPSGVPSGRTRPITGGTLIPRPPRAPPVQSSCSPSTTCTQS